ncbi:MAG TPA: glycosyl hydrolase family 28 protein, partial [Fimbriimonadaceae bacterium]|nr:glycosyl hydrolase family 28 protein [Fimbriimonadaceae bacterium]
LRLEKGAVLRGSPRQHDYDKGVWKAFVIAADAHDIAITGPGEIDGNGAAVAEDVKRLVHVGELTIWPGRWRPNEVDRPEVIEMTRCRDVRVKGISIRGGSGWTQVYRDCVNLRVEGVRVNANAYWNNDGVDAVDCRNVRIADCDIDADDDGICLKSDKHESACENVRIEHCRIRSGASAIKFGTASNGGFRRVKIRDIHVHDTFRSAVALESVDGGVLEDVTAEHVRAVNTGNAFFIRLGHRNPKWPPGRARRVLLKDFDVQVPAGRPDAGYPFPCPPYPEKFNVCPSSIVGLPEAKVRDVRLQNIRVRMPGGADARLARRLDQVPERKAVYPEFSMFGELPSWGLFLRHVRGLRIEGLRLSLDRADYRPAFAAEDVAGVTARRVKVGGADPAPTVIFRGPRVRFPGIHSSIRKPVGPATGPFYSAAR